MLSGEISGRSAAYTKYLLYTPFFRSSILYTIKKNADFSALTSVDIEDEPTWVPLVKTDEDTYMADNDCSFDVMNKILVEKENWPYPTISSYYHSYVNKKITPLDVASKLVDVCNSDLVKKYKAIVEMHPDEIIKAAKESTDRYAKGSQLSVIDGVPFFVKEHMKISGYKTYDGVFQFGRQREKTSFTIQKLLDAGSILIGTTCMPVIGSNAIGVNCDEHFPSPLNPWDFKRYTGGSSSGNGAVLALGLCPFAIGSDSLGSIRVPAGWCGMVGLRPTFGRVSTSGIIKRKFKNAFCVIGPMTCCASDAAIVLRIMGGPDQKCEYGINQPKMLLPVFENFDISSIKFGIYDEYIKLSEPCLIDCFDKVVNFLKSKGCLVKNIYIPEIPESLYATFIKMMSKAGTKLELCKKKTPYDNIPDISLHMMKEVGSTFTESDIMKTDRQRTRTIKSFQSILENVDVIMLLTTSNLPARKTDYHKEHGFFEGEVFTHSTHYSNLSSLTGIPSLSINIGYDSSTGLPISLQLMTKWWREDILFSVANVIEKFFPLTKTPLEFQKIIN